jgi:transcriptional regulator with XRE-family HTH domain
MFEVETLARFPKSIMNPRTPQNPRSQQALGKAIRDLRKKQGDNQAALAEEAGITSNMLSLIERGEGNPSWTTVEGIAKALGISVAELAKVAERRRAS